MKTEKLEVNTTMTGMVTMSQFTADPNAAHSSQSLTGSRASSAPRTIVVTEKLLHFLKQGPDRGTRVLMMVAGGSCSEPRSAPKNYKPSCMTSSSCQQMANSFWSS